MKQSSISARETTKNRLRKAHLDYLKTPKCTKNISFAEWLDRVSKGEIPLEK